MKVKVKYLRDIPHIQKFTNGDWVDLCAGEDVHIEHGEFKLIPLGVAMQLPLGFEAIVAPRSSLFKKHGLIQTNGIGIIDESYNGDGDEWKFPAYNLGESVDIPKGTRICQFRLLPHQPAFALNEVDILGNTDRGGFGSTGE